MRRLVACIALLVAATGGAAGAQERTSIGGGRDQIDVRVERRHSSPAATPTSARPSSAPSRGSGTQAAPRRVIQLEPGFWDGVCEAQVGSARCGGAVPDGEPGDPDAPAPRQLSPEEIVESLVASLPLPVPEPKIEPGYMLAGKRAFLETQGTTTHTFDPLDTPLGVLRITATGHYTVDWGDGTRTGPHHSDGGPWPDGDITHVYQDAGRYSVVVTQHWTASWALAGESGTVGGLQTQGRIDDFEVQQVQAVRNH